MKFSFKKISKEHRPLHPRSHDVMNPSRDWFIILALAVLGLVGGAAYIAFDFYAQFGIAENAPLDPKGVGYQAQDVTYYAQMYEEREAAFTRLRKDRYYTPLINSEGGAAASGGVMKDGDTPLAEVILAQ